MTAMVERRTDPKVLLADILNIGDLDVKSDKGMKFMLDLYDRFGAPRASLFQSLSKVEKSETPEKTFAEEYLRHVSGKVELSNERADIWVPVDVGRVGANVPKKEGHYNLACGLYEVGYIAGQGSSIRIEKSCESLIDAMAKFEELKLPADAVKKSLEPICGEPILFKPHFQYWCKYPFAGRPVTSHIFVEGDSDVRIWATFRMQ